MGDITVLAPSRVSKTSLNLDRSSIGSGIPIEAPAFTLPPRNIRVPLGGTARFDGKVRGYPEPRVTWHRNGQPVAEEDRFSMDRIIRGTFCLVIKGVQAGDDGKYTCEAANEGGVRQVTVELTVEGSGGKKYGLPSSTKTPGSRSMVSSADNKSGIWGESPPKFVTKPSKVIVKEGQMGRFSCKITGRPPPQVNWFKGDVQLQHGGRFNMVEKSGLHILEIQDVRLLDAGTYTCAVTNSSGKASLSTELVVQGSDVMDSFSVQPTTTVSKTPKSSEVQQITTNGIVKEQKTSSTDITFKGKEQPTSTKETQHVSLKEAPSTPTKDIPDNKQKQVKESRTEASRATKVETKKSNPPESSASTITLQSIKIQPAQRTHSKMSSISASEERKTAAQEPPLQTKKTSSTPQARSRDFESRKVTVEHNRDVRGSPPAFDIQPVNQEATEGEDVTFRCKVSGRPKPSVEWFKDGAPVTRRECAQECDEDGVHSLCLQKTHVGDSGSYSCTVSNSRGSITSNWMLTVNSPKVEEIAPHFSSTLEGCVVTEGQSFALQCSVEGMPEPEISWLLNDEIIPDLQSTFEDGVATLTVQKALLEDDGVYTCVAENSAGKESCSATVTVQEKKIQKSVGRSRAVQPSKISPPVFLKGLSDQKVMDGSQVIMTVEVSANPPPEVNWLHNGKEIQESEDFHFEKKGNEYSLYIQEVFPEDTGKYTCEVWNDEGEAVSEATLTVQEPQDGIQPWFISKPKSVTATAGENVLISCAIAGDPFPAVHWLKDGRELVEKEGIEILQNEDVFTLVMRNAQAQDAGRYEIQLKNPVGECSCQVSLTFRESSVSRGSPRREGREQTSPDESQDVADHGAVRFGRRGSAPRSFGDIRPAEQEQEDIRGLLKRRIEVRERTEDRLREQEAEQLDFRNVLGKKVSTKAVSEEALKEIPAEQMDFRANLQRQVKPKTLSEDERKVNTPQQVDFRAVLAKKGTPKPAEKVAPKPSNPDFRSLLSHKTKPLTENGNGTDAVENAKTPPKENDSVNCEHGCEMVDGGVNEKKPQDKGVAPSFLEKLQDAQIVDGEKLVLQCRIAADPPATVTWTLNGKTIKSSKFIVISQEGPLCSLIIEKAFPEDEGAYKCIAANGAGTAECACNVLVDDSKATKMKSKTPRSSLSPLPATQSKPL